MADPAQPLHNLPLIDFPGWDDREDTGEDDV